MSMLTDKTIDELSVAERLDWIARLWDSIPEAAIPIPEWHMQEIEKRLAAADADPGAAITWEQMKAKLRGKQ